MTINPKYTQNLRQGAVGVFHRAGQAHGSVFSSTVTRIEDFGAPIRMDPLMMTAQTSQSQKRIIAGRGAEVLADGITCLGMDV